MADFFRLSESDRLAVLTQAADSSGRPPHLLDKDVWVVWALQHLYAAPFAAHLVFKGGTSLAKAYGVIQRFSEDVDLTYDIRAIAGDLVGEMGSSALPSSKSQEKKWSTTIRSRLAQWVLTEVVPLLERGLEQQSLPGKVRPEGDKVYIDFKPLALGTGYISSSVLLEFGARSTGEPWHQRPVLCEASAHVRGVEFPQALPQVMRAERTFGRRPPPFTFSVNRAPTAGANGLLAIGTTSAGSMPPASPTQPLRIRRSQRQWPIIRASSSPRRARMARGSTIKPPFRADFGSFLKRTP